MANRHLWVAGFLSWGIVAFGCTPMAADDPFVDDDDVGDDDVGDDDLAGDPWCWTVAPVDGQLAVLQLDPGAATWSEYGRYGQGVNSSFHTGGIARQGDTLVMAAYLGNNFQWVELDLVADVFTAGGGTSEVSVSTHAGDLVAFCGGGVCTYPDFAALDANSPASVVPCDYYATRHGVHGDTLYTAWHSTTEIDVFDVFSGAYLDTLELEDYDTWVWGISRVGDVLYVIDDGRGAYSDQGVRIASFDAFTGTHLGSMFVDLDPLLYGQRPSGLWCE